MCVFFRFINKIQPTTKMVVEMHVNSSPVHHNEQNGKSKSTGYNNNNNLYKEQLAVIKTNFLNPNEVTFCDVSDEDVSIASDNSRKTSRRKRLLSTDTDTDSITSSVHPAAHKKKPLIPDGGYGWMVSFFLKFYFCLSLKIS